MPEPMNTTAFWQQKLLQLLHDPPDKLYEMLPGLRGEKRGGHETVSKAILTLLVEETIKWIKREPDWIAAGADRPVFPARQSKGGQLSISWPKEPIITHPLEPGGCRLIIQKGGVDESTAGVFEKKDITTIQDKAVEQLAETKDTQVASGHVWEDGELLKLLFLLVWRRLRHTLIRHSSEGNNDPLFSLLWQLMPTDSRCPDHAIWEHTRLASALSFVTGAKGDEAPRAPWLFRFEIGPVGRFIKEARTSRDLWMGSFLLSDLIWHAMRPVVEAYGPDVILFPDLRENPLADIWLWKDWSEALPESVDNPFTYAAVLPNMFTAVLPRGTEKGHLVSLEKLAEKSEKAVKERWKELSDLVKKWLTSHQEVTGETDWHDLWDAQQEGVLHTTWSAVRWSRAQQVKTSSSLFYGDPLTNQRPRETDPPSPEDREAIAHRREQLAPFVPIDTWIHYERARRVFAHTCLNYLQLERGFDYALTHHQLRVRHAMRKLTSPEHGIFDQKGEKCTVCGRRQAIYSLKDEKNRLHTHRRAARKFWKVKKLNPDPLDQDRLCGVCATKRFLVVAGVDAAGTLTGINPLWAGPASTLKTLDFDDGVPRVPFPSTATLAAQNYLERICNQPEMKENLQKIVKTWSTAHLGQTNFARALRTTARLADENNSDDLVRLFLMLDTQQSLFPETLDIIIRKNKLENDSDQEKRLSDQEKRLSDQQKKLSDLKEAVVKLREKAASLGIPEPNTRIAVIRMDGDNMGQLLLGDPDRIGATWEDVLHPKAVDIIKGRKQPPHKGAVAAGWPDLLSARRLMGPSLHAFISRALAVFSHRIVPWVVEMEFPGRLIYSGGDDILAMVPAASALDMTARLQQLFCAPFILDTMSEVQAWGWRNTRRSHDLPRHARDRFLIPIMPKQGDVAQDSQKTTAAAIQLPIRDISQIQPYIYPSDNQDPCPGSHQIHEPAFGEVLPLLGSHNTLSAGIAMGHFKHPLQEFLDQSETLLKEVAKKEPGKRSVAMSHFSRSGEKTRLVMPWTSGEKSNVHLFQRVVAGFKNGVLPKRLPYKLNEYRQLLADLTESGKPLDDVVVRGLFKTAFDSTEAADSKAGQDAFALWRLEHHTRGGGNGLQLARTLSSLEAVS